MTYTITYDQEPVTLSGRRRSVDLVLIPGDLYMVTTSNHFLRYTKHEFDDIVKIPPYKPMMALKATVSYGQVCWTFLFGDDIVFVDAIWAAQNMSKATLKVIDEHRLTCT